MNFGFVSAMTIMMIAMLSAVLYEYKRPGRKWPIHIFFVFLFQLFALVYLVWQLALLSVSWFRICTGGVGEWVVTERARKPAGKEGSGEEGSGGACGRLVFHRREE